MFCFYLAYPQIEDLHPIYYQL